MTDTLPSDRPWPLADQPSGPPPPPGAGEAPGAPGDGSPPDQVDVANSPWRALLLLAGLGFLALLGLPIFLMVMAILVSVFLHEMGHYLAAKKTGMKVTEYFIGFGPKLWSFRRGETEYGVKAIPAGAYVRIIGMHSLEEVDAVDEARTYRQASYWRRAITIFAGPAMNLLIAFVLIFGLFVVSGRPDPTGWTVAETVQGSAAEAAGIEPGDDIVSIGGQDISDWDSFGSTVTDRAGDTVDVVVLRDGEEVTLSMTIGERLTASGAAALGEGLYADDVIVGVDGVEVANHDELVGLLEDRGGETVTLAVARRVLVDGDVVDAEGEVAIRVPQEVPTDATRGFAGLARRSGPAERLGPFEAITATVDEFGTVSSGVAEGFAAMFSPTGIGSYVDKVFSTSPAPADAPAPPEVEDVSTLPPPASSPDAVGDDANRFISILGIVQIGSDVAEESWVAFVGLVILMNVFLGFINLLPLPPLDGGHLAVATYEKVRSMIAGRPYHADMAKLLPVTYAVFMVFVFIGLSSLYLDIVDPVQVP